MNFSLVAMKLPKSGVLIVLMLIILIFLVYVLQLLSCYSLCALLNALRGEADYIGYLLMGILSQEILIGILSPELLEAKQT